MGVRFLLDCAQVQVHRKIDIKPGEIRCPRCFGTDLVPSLPRGIMDALMLHFRRVPRHCRFCEKRFYVHEDDLSKIPQP